MPLHLVETAKTMSSTFGERLRAAMLAAGMETPAQLGRLCGVNARTAERWLGLEDADLSAKTAYRVARCLKVRSSWLVAGEGEAPFSEAGTAARAIINRMSPTMARRWLALGRRMAGGE